MGFFNISAFAMNAVQPDKKERKAEKPEKFDKTQTAILRFANSDMPGNIVTDIRERRKQNEKRDAKLSEANTAYLKKMAVPIQGDLTTLSDLLSARSKIESFKYYRNCTEKYDTSEIDDLLYAFEKQEAVINTKIKNISNGSSENENSMHLYSNIKRDFYA